MDETKGKDYVKEQREETLPLIILQMSQISSFAATSFFYLKFK